MKNNKVGVKTLRFEKEKSAIGFANRTGGQLIDCRMNENKKSNFKVRYSREGAITKERNNFYNGCNGDEESWESMQHGECY